MRRGWHPSTRTTAPAPARRPGRRAGWTARPGSARAPSSWRPRGSRAARARTSDSTKRASPSKGPSGSNGSVFLRCRRNGDRVSGVPSSSSRGSPVSASRTTTSIGKRSCGRQLEEPGLGLQRGPFGAHRLGERGGRDLAESLDVERAARAHVLDAPAHLRRAGAGVGAPQVDVALLRGSERASRTRGSRVGMTNGTLGAVAQLDDRAEHLGDDVARLAEHHGVADQHALQLHDVLVVQRRLAHHRPGHLRRLHDGEGRRPPGAPDRDDDVEQLRVDLLGRVLVGDRPPRRTAGRAELVVQRQLVDLDDDPVDLVLDGVPVLAVVPDEVVGALRGVDHREVPARREDPTMRAARTPRSAPPRAGRATRRCRARSSGVVTPAAAWPRAGARSCPRSSAGASRWPRCAGWRRAGRPSTPGRRSATRSRPR